MLTDDLRARHAMSVVVEAQELPHSARSMKEKGTKVSTRPVYRTWRARLMIDDDLSTCGCHNRRFIVVEQKRAPAHCRRGDAHVR